MQDQVIFLNGWGQIINLNDKYPCREFNYFNKANIDLALEDLALFEDNKYFIGWSLGAAILIEAISRKIINPTKLILIAPIYKFVDEKLGIKAEIFKKFSQELLQNQELLLKKFNFLIVQNDKNAKQILKKLNAEICNIDKNILYYWLDYLSKFSYENYNIDCPTLIIHGKEDNLVNIEQANLLHKSIANSRFLEIDGAAHAPHLSDPILIENIIYNEFR